MYAQGSVVADFPARACTQSTIMRVAPSSKDVIVTQKTDLCSCSVFVSERNGSCGRYVLLEELKGVNDPGRPKRVTAPRVQSSYSKKSCSYGSLSILLEVLFLDTVRSIFEPICCIGGTLVTCGPPSSHVTLNLSLVTSVCVDCRLIKVLSEV